MSARRVLPIAIVFLAILAIAGLVGAQQTPSVATVEFKGIEVKQSLFVEDVSSEKQKCDRELSPGETCTSELAITNETIVPQGLFLSLVLPKGAREPPSNLGIVFT